MRVNGSSIARFDSGIKHSHRVIFKKQRVMRRGGNERVEMIGPRVRLQRFHGKRGRLLIRMRTPGTYCSFTRRTAVSPSRLVSSTKSARVLSASMADSAATASA